MSRQHRDPVMRPKGMTWKPLVLVTAALVAVVAPPYTATSAAALAPPSGSTRSHTNLHTYVYDWVGHTRSLDIRRDHTATETIYSGCCTHVLTVRFVVHGVRGSAARGSLGARVIRVWEDPAYVDARDPEPVVGDQTRLRLRHGVLHEPLTGATYCGSRAPVPDSCGA